MTSMEALREKVRQLEAGCLQTHLSLPFGVEAMDSKLAEGGLAYGAVHEVAGGANGAIHGAAAALFAAGIMARTTGEILWCVKQRDLFAPALARAGLDMKRVIFAEVGDDKQVLACFEEGLRHGGVIGVVGEVSKLPMIASRRLQLAAEKSGAIGIAIRRWWRISDAEDYGKQPTAARTRWRITALPSTPLPVQGIGTTRWRVELTRCRAGEYATFDVKACNETGRLTLSSDMVYRPRETSDGNVRAAS